MDPAAHRRIELQAPEDLTYLIDNVRRAAAESISAAFPPVEDPLDGQEDELRNRIEQLVNDYIQKTFTLASPNLTINGLPLSNPSHFLSDPNNNNNNPSSSSDASTPQVHYEYEPFDSRKRDRIEQLVSQEEDLLRSIAALKRRAPHATATKWSDATRTGIVGDEEALQQACERFTEEGAVTGRKPLEGMGGLERQEGVERRWGEAVGGLGRLKRDMPAAVAKMERARVAAGYVTKGVGKSK